MKNETILMTGCESWDHWRQTHNIANIWARKNKVIFVHTDRRYENMRVEKGRFQYLRSFWHQEIKWVEENIGCVKLVFAASQKLYDNKKDLHSSVHLIPNAGDFKMFNSALTEKIPEPEDLRSIPHPRIVLIGGLGWDVDYDLLGYVADSHPEWSVVMIGLVRSSGKDGVESVLKRPNAYSLGYKPQPELPAYLQYCDVGLMSYKIEGSIIDGYPLKMHEYLSAGLPVVSVPQPAVLPFSSVVGVSGEKTEFVRLIEKALEGDSAEQVTARVNTARENSWDKRVEEMDMLIDPFLFTPETRI